MSTKLELGPRDSAVIIRDNGEVEGYIAAEEDELGYVPPSAERIVCLLALAHGRPDLAIQKLAEIVGLGEEPS